MEHHLLWVQVEVEVGFHPAVVGVGRHGVPDAAGLQLRQPHHQLTALEALFVDVFVDGPLIRSFRRPDIHGRGLLFAHQLRLHLPVGRSRQQVVHGRVLVIEAPEHHLLLPLAHVEAVEPAQLEGFPTHRNLAVAPHVDDAQLPSLQEKVRLQRLKGRQRQRLPPLRHGSPHNYPVVVGIHEVDFAPLHEPFYQKVFPQLLRVHAPHFPRAALVSCFHALFNE